MLQQNLSAVTSESNTAKRFLDSQPSRVSELPRKQIVPERGWVSTTRLSATFKYVTPDSHWHCQTYWLVYRIPYLQSTCLTGQNHISESVKVCKEKMLVTGSGLMGLSNHLRRKKNAERPSVSVVLKMFPTERHFAERGDIGNGVR